MAKDEETVEEEVVEEETESEDEGAEDGNGSKEDAEGDDDSKDDEDTEEDAEGDESEDKSKGKKSDDEDEPEIPVRKGVAQQNIIARQKNTIKKLRKEKDDDAEESDDDSEEGDNAVSKEVKKALKPVLDILTSRADEDDLNALYSGEPNAKKFDRQIKAYMAHKAYKGVPPEVIYHHLAWNEAQALGSKKKVVADKEASKTRGIGNSKKSKNSEGGIPSVEDLEKMSDADIEKIQNDIRIGKFKA